MPEVTAARSCFRGLEKALRIHFSDQSIRKSYEDARALIGEVLASQPDVLVTQDSLTGFLNGFLLACTQFANAELINRQNDAMFSVIGGVYLLGAEAPVSCQPAQLDALRTGFFQRLNGTLQDALLPQPNDVQQRYATAENAIRGIFRTTPDVPINRESLAGLVLGVMYSHRYLPTDGEGLTAIMVAAYLLANQSDLHPIRSNGPGLW